MALVAGVNIPDRLRVEISLQRIYGIGPTLAKQITSKVGLEDNSKVQDLPDISLNQIREIIDQEHKVEGDLRRETNSNIRRLIEIGSYRGMRHQRGLPVRGQRTKTNARSRKGAKRTVAGRRRSSTKK